MFHCLLQGGLRLVAVSGALLEYTNNDQQMITLALSLVRDYLSSINEVHMYVRMSIEDFKSFVLIF